MNHYLNSKLYSLIRLAKNNQFTELWNSARFSIDTDLQNTARWEAYTDVLTGSPLCFSLNETGIALEACWDDDKINAFDREVCGKQGGSEFWTEEGCIETATKYVVVRTIANAAIRAGVCDPLKVHAFLRHQIFTDNLVPKLFSRIPEPHIFFADEQTRFDSAAVWQPVIAIATAKNLPKKQHLNSSRMVELFGA